MENRIATDEEIARVSEMIHGTFPILWIKAETADGLLSRIAADAETIKAREAAYDTAQEGLKHARKQEAEMRETIRAKDEEIERLKNGEPCAVCGGSGSPTSGLPCACEGSGKLWKAEQRTRRECMELRDQVRVLRGASSTVMRLLEEHGPSIVPHLMDTDETAGQRLRDALAATEPKVLDEVA